MGGYMCCEKCTSHGISTPTGRKMYEQTPPDERWRGINSCIKMTDPQPGYKGKDRVMWGPCRATKELKWVECCRSCDFFS